MPVVALTDITIRSLKPVPGQQVTYLDRALRGFGVRVAPSGAMSFVLTYGPRRTRVKLGDVGIVSLKDARHAAKTRLASFQLGVPDEKPSETYDIALAAFLAQSERRNKSRTVRDYQRLLTRYGFGKIPLSELKSQDIRKRLEALAATPSEQAHAHVALSIFFRFCHRMHYLEADPMIRMQLAKKQSRDRVLSDEEVAAVWKVANFYPFGTIVRLCILLGQRRTEVASLRWEWIDQEKRLITLPAAVTKNRRTHVFPYGSMTADILQGIPREGSYLFPSRRNKERPGASPIFGAWGKDKAALDTASGVSGYVLHDLRRGLSTAWAALGVSLQTTEKYINHISGSTSGVAGIYNRYSYMQEMQTAVTSYEAHLQAIFAKE